MDIKGTVIGSLSGWISRGDRFDDGEGVAKKFAKSKRTSVSACHVRKAVRKEHGGAS